MITNYIKVAWRNLSRQKGFAALNIMGLAVGIAAVLLIFRIITYELSFNTHFSHYDRIVRIVTHEKNQEGETNYTRGIPLPAMVVLKNTIPQWVATSRMKEAWPTIIVPNTASSTAQRKLNTPEGQIGFFAENDFFQIFDFQWLAGDKNSALNQPNALVITRNTAEKCFDNWQNALGKTLNIDNEPMVVQGVVENPPINCEFQVNVFISYATLLSDKEKYEYDESWGGTSSNDGMFALLPDASQLQAAEALVQKVGEKEYADNNRGQETSKQHFLQPLSQLHYDDRYGSAATHVISKERLWILGSIGFLILLMACFNFINLSTAQAIRRSNEVGVRKTLGGSRATLMGQFMSETALVTCMAAIAGVVLAGLTAPLLQHISEVPAAAPFLSLPILWAFLAGLTIIITLLSGFYPATILSGFNPIQALKNSVSNKSVGGNAIRKGLVVFQFAIAQALIVGTIITLNQLNYIRDMDLGFKKDLVYNFDINGDSLSQAKIAGFKQRLLQIPGVESVAFGSDVPSSGSTWGTNFTYGLGGENQNFNTNIKFCDSDYQKTYGFEMVAGRWLEPSDTTKEFVVNEALLKKIGVANPAEALNQDLRLGGGRFRRIVGVVKDFHAHSVHRAVEPIVMGCNIKRMYGAGVKIAPQNMQQVTASIQKEFDQTYPEQVFDAKYFDENIADFYNDENRFAATCKGFGALAIFISCLGLFGLAAHAAQRRTKEIGVRKVLGASVSNITGLLAKDFLLLVVIAILIASPLAWLLMQGWLSDFAYRIEIKWWIFVVSGIIALSIAFLTVSIQSIKAALVNPVKSLKSE